MSTTSLSTTETADVVAQFSATFNEQLLRTHGVASALGCWLLLAVLAPSVPDDERAALEEVLGTTALDAQTRAVSLFAIPHPALRAALAYWYDEDLLNLRGRAAVRDLPGPSTRGPVPSQSDADAWTQRATEGLIAQFPVTIDDRTALVLASVLATKGDWTQPFSDATTDDLGGEFAEQNPEVLRSDPLHVVRLIHTSAAGLVGAHAARTTQGLVVVSVVGEPRATPSSLHAAALEAGNLILGRPSTAHYANLFDPDLTLSDFFEVAERQMLDEGLAQQEEYEALLPAWEVASTHNLSNAPGVHVVLGTLREWLREPDAATAVQSARSKFTKTTFEAAAATAFAYRVRSMPSLAKVTRRYATLRFNRPYAVLALTDTPGADPGTPSQAATVAPDEWRGVPAFAAWIKHVTPRD